MSNESKILVTGSAGFIGFHTTKALLEQGINVVGVDNLSPYYDLKMKKERNKILKKYKNYKFHKTSIADFKKLNKVIKKEQPEKILHLAAQAGVRYSLENPWAYAEANYLGTLNIFESAKLNNIKDIIFASSSSIYGANKKTPFSEDDITDSPISLYAASKKANELLAHSYHHLYGMNVVGLRFFTVYGTFYRPDMALFKFTKKILSDEPIDVYNKGQMKRDFTHVGDIVSGILFALKKDHEGFEIYNLGGGDSIPLMDVVRGLEKRLDKKATINFLPLQDGDVVETSADISKAHSQLHYDPATPFEKGLDEFVAWFKENQKWLLKLKD